MVGVSHACITHLILSHNCVQIFVRFLSTLCFGFRIVLAIKMYRLGSSQLDKELGLGLWVGMDLIRSSGLKEAAWLTRKGQRPIFPAKDLKFPGFQVK